MLLYDVYDVLDKCFLNVIPPRIFVCLPHLNYIADVLKATVALYMENESLPMPTNEEVLVCNEHTTEEEITLLWKRAVSDPNYFRIFSLVHAEKLSYQTCDKALKTLFDITQGHKGYIH